MQIASKKNLILTIDIGTTAMKGALITKDGEMKAYHRVTYWEKTKQDYHSWNPSVWIEALREIVASLGGYQRIEAMAISGQAPTLVPIDSEGKVLHYALLWLDQRRVNKGPSKSFFLPKLAWFKDNCPDIYEKTRWFLSCSEYLNFFLTHECFTVRPSEEFTPFIWSEIDCKSYGIDSAKLPPFITMGQEVGKVTSKASLEVGIPEGLPVIAGGLDYLVCLIGAGAVKPGKACDRAGTSEGINFTSSKSVEASCLRSLPHAVPGLYNVSGVLASSGRLFEWLRKITSQADRSYRDIVQELENLPLDRPRPYFIPSLEQTNFEFAHGAFLELNPEHTREDLGRAIVESIGFGIRRIIDSMKTVNCNIQELRVTGGQARNVVWNQMKADMTNKPVLIPEIEDAELLGLAACALVWQKEYKDLAEASDALVRIRSVFNPRQDRAEKYDEIYKTYLNYCSKI